MLGFIRHTHTHTHGLVLLFWPRTEFNRATQLTVAPTPPPLLPLSTVPCLFKLSQLCLARLIKYALNALIDRQARLKATTKGGKWEHFHIWSQLHGPNVDWQFKSWRHTFTIGPWWMKSNLAWLHITHWTRHLTAHCTGPPTIALPLKHNLSHLKGWIKYQSIN